MKKMKKTIRYIVHMKDLYTNRSKIIANVSTKAKAKEITKIYPGSKISKVGKRRKKRK